MWFKRFKSGYFSVKDEVRSGHPVTDKICAIFEKVEHDRHISTNKLQKLITLKISETKKHRVLYLQPNRSKFET